MINIGQIIAAVGLLIFAIYLLEKALYYLVGHKLKHILQKFTGPMYLAVPIGALSTILLGGSGDLLVILTMVFVTTGIITFRSGLGIIFGTNIGATSLPLLVAILGFNTFDFMSIVIPALAIGGLLIVFSRHEQNEYIAKLLFGFGFLFLAVEWMQSSIGGVGTGFDISQYAQMPLRGFGILGAILVTIMQSGGAIGIIVLTAIEQGIISFPASIAIMLGVNIGTTNTPFLGALGGDRRKLQIALSHVGFNLINVLLGAVFFWQLIEFGDRLIGIEQRPELASAIINMSINIVSAVLFSLCVSRYQKFIKMLVPAKSEYNELESEQVLKQQKTPYGMTLSVAYHNDIKTYLNETILAVNIWISSYLMKDNQYYPANRIYKAQGQAKHLLSIGIEFARNSRNIEHEREISQAKRILRKCYQVYQLIQKADRSLQKHQLDDGFIANIVQQNSTLLGTSMQELLEDPSKQNLEFILGVFNQLKNFRIQTLQSILSYLQDSIPDHDSDKATHFIIFNEHLYYIFHRSLLAIAYFTLGDEDVEILEQTVF